MQSDPITRPAHYTKYSVEVIEITRHLPFCLGNVVKYVLRAPFKNGAEDCDKALVYLGWCNGPVILSHEEWHILRANIDQLQCDLFRRGEIEALQMEFLKTLTLAFDGNYGVLRPVIEELAKALYCRQMTKEKHEEIMNKLGELF